MLFITVGTAYKPWCSCNFPGQVWSGWERLDEDQKGLLRLGEIESNLVHSSDLSTPDQTV